VTLYNVRATYEWEIEARDHVHAGELAEYQAWYEINETILTRDALASLTVEPVTPSAEGTD
jgi:hypothetical protein